MRMLTLTLFRMAMVLLVSSGVGWTQNDVHSPSVDIQASGSCVTAATEPCQLTSLSLVHPLRTDLRGGSISIALPENAPDEAWDNELMRRFEQMTGINV